MRKLLKRMSPARIIALGFAATIFIGSGLLMLPCSVQNGVDLKYIDALYTSASAVCVTGLVTVDIGDTFTAFGQFVVAALIQIGGLGVASMGAGVILAVGKRINLKGRRVLRDAMNLDSGKGIVKFIKSVFLTTAAFELVGAALSFIVFVRDYPPLKALGISFFHSVAAFNNSCFDTLSLTKDSFGPFEPVSTKVNYQSGTFTFVLNANGTLASINVSEPANVICKLKKGVSIDADFTGTWQQQYTFAY